MYVDGGTRWIVRDHQDGTAQLIVRWGTHGLKHATRHTLASEVRADMVRRGLPLDVWPAT